MSQTSPAWKPVATNATFLLAVAIGTGGLSTTELYARKSQALLEGTAPVLPQPKFEAKSASIEIERLGSIRSLLRIGVGDVGKMFGVSRQSVYDWLSGKQPSQERVARIAEVSNALLEQRVDLEAIQGRVGTRLLPSGETLVQIIANGGQAESALRQLISVFSHDTADREALTARLRERKRSGYGANDFDSQG